MTVKKGEKQSGCPACNDQIDEPRYGIYGVDGGLGWACEYFLWAKPPSLTDVSETDFNQATELKVILYETVFHTDATITDKGTLSELWRDLNPNLYSTLLEASTWAAVSDHIPFKERIEAAENRGYPESC